MADEAEERCPFCNGVGRLPTSAVARVREEQRDVVLVRHVVSQLWVLIADLSYVAAKKTKTPISVEHLQACIKETYARAAQIVPRDGRGGGSWGL